MCPLFIKGIDLNNWNTMTYNPIKNFVMTVVLCLSVTVPSFAQDNVQAMRLLTVNALMQYGQKLYDRGDFNEAGAVFKHVLAYDGHQPQALQYLNNMGYAPPAVEKPTIQLVDGIDISDTQSLKKAIEHEKETIQQLQGQIIQMRANSALPSQ